MGQNFNLKKPVLCWFPTLPMVMDAGVYYFNLIDSYGASGVSIMIVAECKVSFSNITIKRPDLTVLGPNNQANSW